jgi:hypothetical protein
MNNSPPTNNNNHHHDHLLVIALGATLFQAYDTSLKSMKIAMSSSDLLGLIHRHEPHLLSTFHNRTHVIDNTTSIRTGAALSIATIFWLRDQILQEADKLSRATSSGQLMAGDKSWPPAVSLSVLVVAGTDTLDELAFALELLLPQQVSRLGICRLNVAICGSMKPSDRLGFDGPANVADGLRFLVWASSGHTTSSSSISSSHAINELSVSRVVVVMDSCIHLASEVQKSHSSALSAFTSSGTAGATGPAGIVDRGAVKMFRWGSAMEYWEKWRSEFDGLRLEDLRKVKVPILTLGVGMNMDIANSLNAGQMTTSPTTAASHSSMKGNKTKPPSPALSTPSPDPPSFDPTFQIPAALLSQIDGLVLALPGSG